VKSDRSVVVLHHLGLGRTIGFQAAVANTSSGKHPESPHQLIVRSRCLRHPSKHRQNKCLVYTELDVECQALVAPYPF